MAFLHTKITLERTTVPVFVSPLPRDTCTYVSKKRLNNSSCRHAGYPTSITHTPPLTKSHKSMLNQSNLAFLLTIPRTLRHDIYYCSLPYPMCQIATNQGECRLPPSSRCRLQGLRRHPQFSSSIPSCIYESRHHLSTSN